MAEDRAVLPPGGRQAAVDDARAHDRHIRHAAPAAAQVESREPPATATTILVSARGAGGAVESSSSERERGTHECRV